MPFKILPLFLFSIPVLFSWNVMAQNANDISGIWMTQEGKGEVEIYKKAGTYKFYGKIVWLKNQIDKSGNPVKDIKGTAVMNLIILKEFIFKDGKWVDGTIYDPETGDTYYCTIVMEDHNTLKIRGSIDPMGWIGKTKYWDRVK